MNLKKDSTTTEHTLHIRISLWELWRAITFRLVVTEDAASSVMATFHIRTGIHLAFLTKATSFRISDTAVVAATFIATGAQFSAHRIFSTRITKACSRRHLLTLDHRISHMTWWTRTLWLPIDYTTLGVYSTSIDLQTRILAGPALASLLGITVAILLTLE